TQHGCGGLTRAATIITSRRAPRRHHLTRQDITTGVLAGPRPRPKTPAHARQFALATAASARKVVMRGYPSAVACSPRRCRLPAQCLPVAVGRRQAACAATEPPAARSTGGGSRGRGQEPRGSRGSSFEAGGERLP